MSEEGPNRRTSPITPGGRAPSSPKPSTATPAGPAKGAPPLGAAKAGPPQPRAPQKAPKRRSPPVVRRRTRARLAVAAAPFWRRLLADVIDLCLVAAVALGSFRLGIGAPEELPEKRFDWIDYAAELLAEHTALFLPPAVMLCAIGVLYGVITRAAMGATPGERLFGLSLMDLDGHPCSPFRALFHAVGTILGLLLGLVGYGWAAVDLKRQGLAEYLSGTLLIHGRPSPD